jgi:hypothetical protein
MRMSRAALGFALILAACTGNAFELETGQCLDEPSSEEVVDVDIVSCAEPHDLEIYRVAELPDQAFDVATLDAASFDLCLEGFDDFVGMPYVDSELDIYYLMPSEDSWADGDREVVCAVYDLSGERLTGSAELIGR